MSYPERTPFIVDAEVDEKAAMDSTYSHHEEILDEALMESFPASDPVAVNFGYVARPRLCLMVKTSEYRDPA